MTSDAGRSNPVARALARDGYAFVCAPRGYGIAKLAREFTQNYTRVSVATLGVQPALRELSALTSRRARLVILADLEVLQPKHLRTALEALPKVRYGRNASPNPERTAVMVRSGLPWLMLAARADRDDSNSELQNYLLAGNRLGAMSVGPQPDGHLPAELRPALGGHPALLAAAWDELARGARVAELVEHPESLARSLAQDTLAAISRHAPSLVARIRERAADPATLSAHQLDMMVSSDLLRPVFQGSAVTSFRAGPPALRRALEALL
jgi:hypothetical protein